MVEFIVEVAVIEVGFVVRIIAGITVGLLVS